MAGLYQLIVEFVKNVGNQELFEAQNVAIIGPYLCFVRKAKIKQRRFAKIMIFMEICLCISKSRLKKVHFWKTNITDSSAAEHESRGKPV